MRKTVSTGLFLIKPVCSVIYVIEVESGEKEYELTYLEGWHADS